MLANLNVGYVLPARICQNFGIWRNTEVRQLIEPDERNLGTLPVEFRGLMLQVPETDRRSGRKAIFKIANPSLGADQRVKLAGLIPKSALVGDLWACPAEDDAAEILVADVAEGLQQERKTFT